METEVGEATEIERQNDAVSTPGAVASGDGE
jgi:hypothetical protein